VPPTQSRSWRCLKTRVRFASFLEIQFVKIPYLLSIFSCDPEFVDFSHPRISDKRRNGAAVLQSLSQLAKSFPRLVLSWGHEYRVLLRQSFDNLASTWACFWG